MHSRFERVSSSVLTLAAVVIAVSVLKRDFFPSPARRVAASDGRPVYIADWTKLLDRGIRSGANDAKVTIIEFSDLECPFCRQFHGTLREAQKRYGGNLAHVFLHYPLTTHRFGRPAARAAECAGNQGRFSEFVDRVFSKQDSLGLKSWTAFAWDAGIRDTTTFIRCAMDTARVPRIEAGRALGDEVGVQGTPTVIVNGWRFPGTPSDSQLFHAIDALLAGRSVVSSASAAPLAP